MFMPGPDVTVGKIISGATCILANLCKLARVIVKLETWPAGPVLMTR
jgi:hypothetical protein